MLRSIFGNALLASAALGLTAPAAAAPVLTLAGAVAGSHGWAF